MKSLSPLTRWASIAATFMLFGCSLAPTYERPAAPVASQWPGPNQKDETTGEITDLQWSTFFRDDRLKQVIRIALQNNRDLRVATANIEKARALYGVQSSERLPHLDATVSGTHQRAPADVSVTGRNEVTRDYFAGVGIPSFELDFFGRVKNLSDAAFERYTATENAKRTVELALVAQVASTYEALAADKRLVELSQQTLDSRSDSHQRQLDLYRQGASSEYDLQQSQSLLEAARAVLARQVRQTALHENALTVLMGAKPDDTLLPVAGDFGATDLLADIPVAMPSSLLENRPDIRQGEALLRASYADIGAARAAFFPRITLTSSLGTSSSELSGLFDAGSRTWAFIPQLTLPIFDAGRNRANLNVAKADREIALAQYEKTIQVAFREVSDSLVSRTTLIQELAAVRAQQDAEARRFALARQRYESGYSSYLEYLDAQRSLFAVQQQTITTALGEIQNRITLYKSLGGGWSKATVE
jgi:multidrug efflux system outer membrane protein